MGLPAKIPKTGAIVSTENKEVLEKLPGCGFLEALERMKSVRWTAGISNGQLPRVYHSFE